MIMTQPPPFPSRQIIEIKGRIVEVLDFDAVRLLRRLASKGHLKMTSLLSRQIDGADAPRRKRMPASVDAAEHEHLAREVAVPRVGGKIAGRIDLCMVFEPFPELHVEERADDEENARERE